MLRKLSIGCVSLALLLGAASADLVDEFTDPTSAGESRTSTGVTVTEDTGLSGVMGGSREVRLRFVSGGGTTLWDIPSTADIWRFDTDAATTATAALNYGENPEWNLDSDATPNESEDGGTDPTTGGLNIDFGTDTAFEFLYTSDQDTTLDVQLTSDLGGGSQVTKEHSITLDAHNTVPRTSAYAPFSLWSSIDFGDVDSITFYLRDQTALDVTLENISSIPEPATISLLGLGALALARRRRRRRK